MRNIIPKGGYVTDYNQLLSKVLQLEKIINEGGGSASDATCYYYVNSGRDSDGPYTDTPIHYNSENNKFVIEDTGTASLAFVNKLLDDIYSGKRVILMALDDVFNAYPMQVAGYSPKPSVYHTIGFAIKYNAEGVATSIPIMLNVK